MPDPIDTQQPSHQADESWRVFRIMAEFVDGFQTLSNVGHAVSVFGSARTKADTPLYDQARRCGRLLAEKGHPS